MRSVPPMGKVVMSYLLWIALGWALFAAFLTLGLVIRCLAHRWARRRTDELLERVLRDEEP
jgi:hypothetical protein